MIVSEEFQDYSSAHRIMEKYVVTAALIDGEFQWFPSLEKNKSVFLEILPISIGEIVELNKLCTGFYEQVVELHKIRSTYTKT